MLKSIYIDGYKGLRGVNLAFAPGLSTYGGGIGSGKSALCQLLARLRFIARGSSVVSQLFPVDLISASNGQDVPFVSLTYSDATNLFQYKLTLGFARAVNGYLVAAETLTANGTVVFMRDGGQVQLRQTSYALDRNVLAMPTIASLPGDALSLAKAALAGIFVLHPLPPLMGDAINTSVGVMNNIYGIEFTSWLNWYMMSYPADYETLVQKYRSFDGRLVGFNLGSNSSPNRLNVLLQSGANGNASERRFAQFSDAQKWVFFFAAMSMAAERFQQMTIVIDDPLTGMPREAKRRVLAIIKSTFDLKGQCILLTDDDDIKELTGAQYRPQMNLT